MDYFQRNKIIFSATNGSNLTACLDRTVQMYIVTKTVKKKAFSLNRDNINKAIIR